MKIHPVLIVSAVVGLAACANSAPVKYTDEGAYLNAIHALDIPTVFEGFEDDAVWGEVRSTIAGAHTASNIVSNGITWTSNNSVSQVTTGPGAARTGNWGFFTLPHGDYPHGIGDGFRLNSSTRLFAAGGWVETNTPFAEINLVLDGTRVVDFGDPVIGTQPMFFGIVDSAGFRTVEFREIEGSIDDQKYIFADDFTLAGRALNGDYNQDGTVDAADYVLWRKGFGTAYTQDEYNIWRANFGQVRCLFPTFELHPQSQTVSVGSDVTLFVEVSGTRPLVYQWFKDDVPIANGGQASSFSIIGVNPAHAGDYRAWCSNACGTAASDTATLAVVQPGDFNQDGSVDAADYVVWRNGLGTTYTQDDYNTSRTHFGQTTGSSASSLTSATGYVASPEPATLWLLGLAIVFLNAPNRIKRTKPTSDV